MNYIHKYKKYKSKYYDLKRLISRQNKYAIVMLCIVKDHYVLGACISAYVHKQLIKNTDNNVDLIIMCDDTIYDKHKNTLSHYFDQVVRIDLIKFGLDKKFKFSGKYENFMNVSVNKWQCFNFVDYDKILFLDIGVLVISEDFYDVFTYNTNAFMQLTNKKNLCTNNSVVKYLNPYNSYRDYIYKISNPVNFESLKGGIVLLKPSKIFYEQYVTFINNVYITGAYSTYKSGIDETSLYYFLIYENNDASYNICPEYCVIPWDEPQLTKDALSYQYSQFIKPWNKPTFLSWDEELIWRYVYNVMPKNIHIEKLFRDTLIINFKEAVYISKQNPKLFSKYYNDRFYNSNKNDIIKIYEIDDDDLMYEKILQLEEKFSIGAKSTVNIKDLDKIITY